MTAFNLQQNYFELFQLPKQFQVSLDQLNSRFRDLQRQAHPDRFAGASARDQRLAVQYSAWINQAYTTLQSPVQRAQYLLSLQGIHIDPEQTMANDPAFLMHQISLREQLLELKDQADPESALDALTSKLDTLIDHQCTEFDSCYRSQDYQKAKEVVMKMQFLYKLEEDARQLEADILDY